MGSGDTMILSVGISIILIVAYLAALLFKFVTHRGIYQKQENETEEKEEPHWGKGKAFTVLGVSTIAVAYISENLVGTFEVIGTVFGFSELFIGVIIVAVVGNAAEHGSAVIMAFKNKMNVAIEIAVGSTLQIAMFVLPVLVLMSLMFSTSMPLVFTWPELTSMVAGVLLVVMLMNDGESNWFDGMILLAAYLIMGIGFYLI
ncbi:Ca(2+)/H(+) antiporter ChaA [Lentibacillus sp. JNUCC-1]|nr:Ca(2+)/H(+) antiporter ChaA [Lentibacillus sp. JNUCC-1]